MMKINEAFEEDTDDDTNKDEDDEQTSQESLDDDYEASPELNPNTCHTNNLTAKELSKIVSLQDNIALSLAAQPVCIVAPIPDKQAGCRPNAHNN